jgi:hypothetical protein
VCVCVCVCAFSYYFLIVLLFFTCFPIIFLLFSILFFLLFLYFLRPAKCQPTSRARGSSTEPRRETNIYHVSNVKFEITRFSMIFLLFSYYFHMRLMMLRSQISGIKAQVSGSGLKSQVLGLRSQAQVSGLKPQVLGLRSQAQVSDLRYYVSGFTKILLNKILQFCKKSCKIKFSMFCNIFQYFYILRATEHSNTIKSLFLSILICKTIHSKRSCNIYM